MHNIWCLVAKISYLHSRDKKVVILTLFLSVSACIGNFLTISYSNIFSGDQLLLVVIFQSVHESFHFGFSGLVFILFGMATGNCEANIAPRPSSHHCHLKKCSCPKAWLTLPLSVVISLASF